MPSRSSFLRLSLALSGLAVSCGLPWRKPAPVVNQKTQSSEKEFSLYYPWVDEEIEETRAIDKVLPALGSTSTVLYGTALLLYSKDCPGQIHIITMLRATGFNKIEKAVEKARQNIRDAVWKVVWNSPTFYRAKRNYRTTGERIHDLKVILAETRKAKEDGIITQSEARCIKKLRQKEIANYRHEMQSVVGATASLRKVLDALDLDEIRDIIRGFLFQIMAVLATGHNDGFVGKVISKWCLFLNLGSCFLGTNSKLRYPISKLLLTKSLSSANIDEKQARAIEWMGQLVMFSSAGYLVMKHNATALGLNSAFVSSAIFYRGIRTLVDTFWDKTDDEATVWSTGGGFLRGGAGGILMLALASIGMLSRNRVVCGKLSAHLWIETPFRIVEDLIEKLVLVIDKIM